MERIESWMPALAALATLACAILVGWVAYRLIFRGLARVAAHSQRRLAPEIVERMRPGARLLLPTLAVRAATPSFSGLADDARATIDQGLIVLGIAAVTWLLLGVVGTIASYVRSVHDVGSADNLAARRVHTQVEVLERTADVLIVLFGLALALMTFPTVRQLGTGLLASAGVAGLAVGFAARPLLENLISGIQLALTQPIRVDDVVIAHGEWGRIEEITTTYVVVRIWDERRLIVPFSTFIQQPFENWTRTSADILGTVFLWADYSVPVDAARAALGSIVRDAPLWDGRVCNVQVVDTTEHAVKLRALVSASDSGRAWDLRVHVREQWLRWLQETHPESLPKARVRFESPEAATPAGSLPSETG
jgi:small-conductance mechanosensitive channel